MSLPVIRTDTEWQALLTPEQFRVARKQGTEYAFTGKYHNWKEHGIYACVCCGTDLFLSDTKFDSGTGWPSFYAPVSGSMSSPGLIRRWACPGLKSSVHGAMRTLVMSSMTGLPLQGSGTA